MSKLKTAKKLPLKIINQMVILAGSGFSVVAALAWNEVVKSFIDTYIKPYAAHGSGVLAQLIYAILVTALVVFVTLQLAWLQERLEKKQS